MRILMIVPPDRRDFYSYLEADKDNDYLLLWHESKRRDVQPGIKFPDFFKEIFFWDQFISPQRLLKKIKPDTVVFFEIIDQRQIALIVAAGKRKITTFYLEHGAAGSKETSEERSEVSGFLKKQRIPYLFDRLKKSLGHVLKSKFFYYSNLSGFSNTKHLFLYWKLPFLMLKYTPNKALTRCLFRERVPRYSIVFNKVNFRQYQFYTGINEIDALFTGIPLFDTYYQATENNNEHIVYVEQPYLELNLMGWTPEHHRLIAEALSGFANSRKRKLYVKLHPLSNPKLWDHLEKDGSYLQVIQSGDFTQLYLSSSLILGFSSSLLTGLICAKKNIVNIGWHPNPQVFGIDFSKTGLCHLSLTPNELESKFDDWVSHNLCCDNKALYENFLKEFNYPFDGKATQRVIEAITGHAIH